MKQEKKDYPEDCDGCCYRRTCSHELEKCCYLVGGRCVVNEYKDNYMFKGGN